jgi:predicted adenine nucleotide alpha hydrolase (AANH) superfamily ATPase
MRFERAALHAHEHGFAMFTSPLGISRWKHMDQINDCGVRAADRYPQLLYWTWNWRKQGGSQRMIAIAKREHFYQQEYCGCAFSLRDTNAFRKGQGKAPIRLGVRFYGQSCTHDPEHPGS